MFKNRKDAGHQLARALNNYKDQNVLVLAIPRGGVEVGVQIADELKADFSILVSKKLPFPDNSEAGFGAVAEDGSIFMFRGTANWMPEPIINEIVSEQKEVVQQRIHTLREDRPLPEIEGRTVILVDDGIAMGSTMRASVMMCRKQNAGKIVIAAPVSGTHALKDMQGLADDCVILETPPDFRAVAQVYENWYDVPDEEVIQILHA